MYELLGGHSDQLRAEFQLEARLCTIAREHCEDMVARGFFAHTNPDGLGPNMRLYETGYPLPEWYLPSDDTNYIESLYKGWGSDDCPEEAVANWIGSAGHRTHVLGEHSFYRAQILVGVGYARDPATGYGHYAFVSAHEPVGEQWKAPARISFRFGYEQESQATVFRGLRPEAAIQVYLSAGGGPWRLAGCAQVSPEGRVVCSGFGNNPRCLFRLRYVAE